MGSACRAVKPFGCVSEARTNVALLTWNVFFNKINPPKARNLITTILSDIFKYLFLNHLIIFLNSRLLKGSVLFNTMHCSSCNIAKLSQEFPDKTLTADCKHAALHCFRVSLLLLVSQICLQFTLFLSVFIYSFGVVRNYNSVFLYLEASLGIP